MKKFESLSNEKVSIVEEKLRERWLKDNILIDIK